MWVTILQTNIQSISFIYKMNWHIYPWDDMKKKNIYKLHLSAVNYKGSGQDYLPGWLLGIIFTCGFLIGYSTLY
jgi:hypothetical protein